MISYWSMVMKGMKCAGCGKGVMYGHNVSHSKRRTRKIFKPNLHSARLFVGGVKRKFRFCTTCLRLFKSAELEAIKNKVSNKEEKVSVASK
jgi:large subunit ribosomal protein L28